MTPEQIIKANALTEVIIKAKSKTPYIVASIISNCKEQAKERETKIK